ncbi:hypothetical protein [Flavobacterium columnare]|uniref:Lipoprotein n=1 Tax=Flavobacterium columnare TaxID=996 RepID=A0AAI8CHX7_9FLAO|nr:hypothetical protein [Flavobacterium columnare]AMO20461.1 hypothetical protein UN65_09040 [Flavobacterium columnare]AUX18425.1 hypothetical protein AQ623_09185 [Flavobacterium columnare]QOG57508.1 hypothetical protein HUE29_09115 [Flavobacterium columnare]QOG60232.1 hypothetical protein HUE30_09115 [Flavobacterium columnare]QOG62952.1 hypothetical protein HUE31_09115 [Flavobacterium columnare]
MKKIFLGLLALQVLFGCSKNEEAIEETPVSVTGLLDAPYSSLTSEQKKLKLETEAKSTVSEFEKTKTSSTIEAIQNLDKLLETDRIDILSGLNNNGISDVFNVSAVFGIYTWNNTVKRWEKTVSTNNLTFRYPSKISGTTNDAEIVLNATPSPIKVDIIDAPKRYQWVYDPNVGNMVPVLVSNEVLDKIHLPLTVDATIKIKGIDSGNISIVNTYNNNNHIPTTSNLKLTLNDGYALEIKNDRNNSPSVASALLTHNSKSILGYNFNSNGNIDQLLNNNNSSSIDYGKANTLITILDDFAILGSGDIETTTAELEKAESSIPKPNYFSSDYYIKSNEKSKKISDLKAELYNKHSKLVLVSKKDKNKIASIVAKSELVSSGNTPFVWRNGTWEYSMGTVYQKVERYDVKYYLKFDDNSVVAMNVYFSTGFDSLKSQIEDFITFLNK